MTALYSEWDPYAAAWLRNLIAAGHLPAGEVDERSIADVRQAPATFHAFAGIGGWPLALRLAGWPDDVPVWTGSCPCQPFSAAGRKRGTNDERHLWPEFFRLIREHGPAIIFGEQVASPDALQWWDAVQDDLEGAGYACAAVDLCAAGVGAPHIRQRLYWAAIADGLGDAECTRGGRDAGALPRAQAGAERGVWREPNVAEPAGAAHPWRDFEWLTCADGRARPTKPSILRMADGLPERLGPIRADVIAAFEEGLDAAGAKARPRETLQDMRQALVKETVRRSLRGPLRIYSPQVLLSFLCQLREQGWHLAGCVPSTRAETSQDILRELSSHEQIAGASRERGLAEQSSDESTNTVHFLSPLLARCAQEAWRDAVAANAAARSPLAIGVPGRVGKLRAYGNAIVPQVAAEFIRAVIEHILEREARLS